MIKRVNATPRTAVPVSALQQFLDFLQALSDDTRQQIILLVGMQEINAGQIAQHFELSRPTISHHLNVLRRARLLRARKEGKEMYYSLNKGYIVDTLEAIIDLVKCC